MHLQSVRVLVSTDSRYCLQSDLVFRSNEHRLRHTDGGLLCIARDNLVSRTRFQHVQVGVNGAQEPPP